MAGPSIGAQQNAAVTGMPANYVDLLEQMGYMNTPFAGMDQRFLDVENFQRSLKRILDQQANAFGTGTDLSYMPLNLRNIYSVADPILTDPLYGLIGSPGFFSGGFKTGDLPGAHAAAYQTILDQRNAPKFVPPPAAAPSSGGGGGGGSSHALVGSFNVPLQGGGAITVNASDPAAAIANVNSQSKIKASGQGVTQVH